MYKKMLFAVNEINNIPVGCKFDTLTLLKSFLHCFYGF